MTPKEINEKDLETTSGGICTPDDYNSKLEKKVVALRKDLATYRYGCVDCHKVDYNRFEIVGMPDLDRVQLRCTNCKNIHYYKWSTFDIEY